MAPVERILRDGQPAVFILVTIIGLRMALYWRSFIFAWRRYRRRKDVSSEYLRFTDAPYVKIQVTTRGAEDSTPVIARGIRYVQELAAEDPDYYGGLLSVELVTESRSQADYIGGLFAGAPVSVDALVLPAEYATEHGTLLKARGLHYAVEARRAGWNRKPGRTFIVHYDEESVMLPGEIRKLIAVLAGTKKKILEGPIYYPLEYTNASGLCRTMEANRPVGCFECRHVMEAGVPLHLHGSNLVVDEQFENAVGWDIGHHDGQPLIAEDYVFGMRAYLSEGNEAFGWHGCVMLEQPPFSVRSAFRQRHRWVFGVIQGMTQAMRTPEFGRLGLRDRLRIVWGTRFRILSFALGAVAGALCLVYLPYTVYRAIMIMTGHTGQVTWPIMAWMGVIGAMWLGSVLIGAWYNVAESGMGTLQRWSEICLTIALAPVAGIVESSAALWAVVEWMIGRRSVTWRPTPKTLQADAIARSAPATL